MLLSLGGATGGRILRRTGHLAEVVDGSGDAIVAVTGVERRECADFPVPPYIWPATGGGRRDAKRLETAKVLILRVNLGNVGSANDFSREVVAVCQAIRSSEPRLLMSMMC